MHLFKWHQFVCLKKKTEYLATYILRGFSTFMFNNVYVSYVTVIYKQMISYLVVKKCSFLCYFCNFLWHLLLWYVNITTKGATYCAIKIILIRFLKKAPSIQIMQKKIHFTETNSKQFIHVNEFNPLGIKKWCCIQTIIFKSENRWTYTGTKSNPVNKPAKEIVLLFSKPPYFM